MAHRINLGLGAVDGCDDAFVDFGDEPGRAREEVEDAADVGEATHVQRQEDDKVVLVDGGPLLDPIRQWSE